MQTTDKGYLIEQQDLINDISETTGISKSNVKQVFDILYDEIVYYCRDYTKSICEPEAKITIKICKGLYLESGIAPKKEIILNGKHITTTERIKVKSCLSRYFTRQIINGLDGSKEITN